VFVEFVQPCPSSSSSGRVRRPVFVVFVVLVLLSLFVVIVMFIVLVVFMIVAIGPMRTPIRSSVRFVVVVVVTFIVVFGGKPPTVERLGVDHHHGRGRGRRCHPA
jgi:hypothetical protein